MSLKDNVKCILECLDKSGDDITLNKIHDKVILGRGPLTKINDKRCSRSQIIIRLNTHTNRVTLKQLGSNYSGLNGEALVLNEEKQLSNGDIVEVLHNAYKYKVEFDGIRTIDDGPANSSSDEQREDVLPSQSDESEKSNLKRSSEEIAVSPTEVPSKKFKLSASEDPIDSNMKGSWEFIDNGKMLVFTSNDVRDSAKIASFDLDGTLVTTKSGKVFPIDTHDWKLLFHNMEACLDQYVEDGYKIIIFTNQAGIGKKKVSSRDFQKKAESIIKVLKVPIQMFVATQSDKYRKPVTGMWDYLIQEKNGGIKIDMTNSFYCGDAAGRAANWAPKKKKDFACSDYLFALNLNLKFSTPEEIFLKEKAPPLLNLPSFKPKEVVENSRNKSLPDIPHDKKQVLIMVGSQGSGKSYFVSTYLKPLNYTIVNRDTLGSWQKCVSVMEGALSSGSSVVVDNTNPDRESRRKFIEAAKKHGVMCLAVLMNISKEHARHNIKFRELTDASHVPIPDILLNTYFSKFQAPSTEEGFADVISVDYISRQFSNAEHEKLYEMYLCDK